MKTQAAAGAAAFPYRLVLAGLLAVSLVLFLGCAAPNPAPTNNTPVLIVNNTPTPGNTTLPSNSTNPGNLSNNSSGSSDNTSIGANVTISNGTADNASNASGLPQQQTVGIALFDPTNGAVRSKVCAVTLHPDTIYAGQEVAIELYAYSASNEKISYLCGDSERIQGFGGLFQDQRICEFDAPGQTKVWIALDGQICASAPLLVLDPHQLPETVSHCEVVADSRKSWVGNGIWNYSAKVQLRNYGPNDTIKWDCSWQTFSRRVGDLVAGNPANGTVILGCQYNFDPSPLDHLSVSANDDYCGDLLPN